MPTGREEHRVKTGGATLRVVSEGPSDGAALIFSNSLGARLEMWDAQAAHFAATRRVIRYEVRGHGGASAPQGPYALADLARDAVDLLDHFGISAADWVGCSLGGMTGQWLLTHHRARIRKAVLANTAAFMGPPSVDWNARIRAARHTGLAAIAEAMKPRWFTPRFNQTHPDIVARVCGYALDVDVEGYCACVAAIRDMDQRAAIRTVTTPVLVIVGSEDPATPPRDGEAIARAIPGARLVTLAAAHIANCEVPEAYNAAVAEFLAE